MYGEQAAKITLVGYGKHRLAKHRTFRSTVHENLRLFTFTFPTSAFVLVLVILIYKPCNAHTSASFLISS